MGEYCGVCCNAAVEPELTSDNDLGYIGVGSTVEGYSIQIRSGDSRPTVLVISKWDNNISQNINVGEYKMKFCPECGRKLIENK